MKTFLKYPGIVLEVVAVLLFLMSDLNAVAGRYDSAIYLLLLAWTAHSIAHSIARAHGPFLTYTDHRPRTR